MKSPWLISLGSVFSLAVLTIFVAGCGGSGSSSTSSENSPVIITSTTLPVGLEGQSYNQTLQATGGTPPYTWTLEPLIGSFPPTMSLSSTGVVSGIPGPGFSGGLLFGVQLVDSGSPRQTATKVLTLPIVALLHISPSVLEGAQSGLNVGLNYTQQEQTSGGVGPFTWGLQVGSSPMPLGWTLDTAKGVIGGVPIIPGNYAFTIQVSDPGPPAQTAAQAYSVTITNNLVVTNQSLPLAVVSKPYHATLIAAGGLPPYTWATNPNNKPPWLTLNPATGVISGTPPQTGPSVFSVTVSDSSPGDQPADAFLQIGVQPPLAYTSATLTDFLVGNSFSEQFVPFEGGIPPYNLQVISGSLPPGISLPATPISPSNGAAFLGNPTTPGTYNFRLQITDAEVPTTTIQQDFSLRVDSRLSMQRLGNDLPNGLEGQPYIVAFQAAGGVPPYTWSANFAPFPPSAPQPAGLTVDSVAGSLNGTPTAPFHGSIAVRVIDSSNPPQGDYSSANLLVLGKLRVATTALPPVIANASLSMQLGATGGIGQYTWTITTGTLPAGLTFNSATGAISGQAAQSGTPAFSVQVSDAGPPAQTSAPQTLQLTVATNLGRNDSIAMATSLSNGTYQASISPFSDPPNGVGNPDNDYYKLTANPGAIVTLEIQAQRLVPPSPLDSVMEIVDSNGTRLTICSPNSSTVGPFNQPCMNDDIETGVVTDSKLTLQVPSNSLSAQTFFARVLDFRGSARPDFLYTLTVSGAN